MSWPNGSGSVAQLLVQPTFPAGTGPLSDGGTIVQLSVSTVVPGGCSTVMTAEVNFRSVMVSVQFMFGQSGALAMIGFGASVTAANGVLPFLIALAGIAWPPLTVIGAGFWPGEGLPPW